MKKNIEPGNNPVAVGLLPFFHSIEWFGVNTLSGAKRWVTAQLDRDTEDFLHLINKSVIVDFQLYKCIAVERFTHCPPWHSGEKIGLMVEAITDEV